MALWIIPGCALEAGAGWKIWVAWENTAQFSHDQIRVTDISGGIQETDTAWDLQPLAGLARNIAVATVTLKYPNPGELYIVTIPGNGEELRLRSMASDLQRPVSFMFSSCFWHPGDREGRYLSAVKKIPANWSPAFKLLMGDQVYADWPSDLDADLRTSNADAVYGHRYNSYWGDEKYRLMMADSANFFVCDDHEYWNDYPEFQIYLMRSWSSYRKKYGKVADDYYQAFQACNNPGKKRWYSFHIGRVSFFVADTRSMRERCASAASHFLSDPQWDDLEAWGRSLRGPGILVLGQPLLQKDGDFRDHSLSNFINDYDRLWQVLERVTRGEGDDGISHDVLVLSGDIHTSRYCVARREEMVIREFISSPASMIQPGSKEAEQPPYQFPVGTGSTARTWKVDQNPFLSLDNTLGLVRMSEGTDGRVRMELGLWRIHPHDSRNQPQRWLNRHAPEGDCQFVFNDEIQLK